MVLKSQGLVPPPADNSIVTPERPRQTRRASQMVSLLKTGKTPQRGLSKFMEKLKNKSEGGTTLMREEQLILDRVESCTGFIVRKTDETFAGKNEGRGTCCVCRAAKTKWYCVRCKRHFCIELSKKVSEVESFKAKIKFEVAERFLVIGPKGNSSKPGNFTAVQEL